MAAASQGAAFSGPPDFTDESLLDVEVETLYGTGTVIHKVWTTILRRRELLGNVISNV